MTISRRNNKIDELDLKILDKKNKNQKISDNVENNNILKIGEYNGLFWSDKNLQDKALVLWDLDQGNWNKIRFNTWIDRVETIISEKFDINGCCHFGALNCNVPRKNWNKLFSDFNKNNFEKWKVLSKNFKIEVVECKKQAVDQRLIKYSTNLMNRNNKPKLIVIISHDSDMIPILNSANSKEIDNMVIRWRKIRPNCKIESVAKHSIKVDKDTCIEIN
jgi:uncharacterized LabA/DUF88 family protein